MDPLQAFERDCRDEIDVLGRDATARDLTARWFAVATALKYSYHFRMAGLPIIQYPQDIVAVQEIIWDVRPDVIIETGIARGGSLVMSAAQLAMLDYCDAARADGRLDIAHSRRRVIGIDIEIRDHNRRAVEAHPLRHKIEMITGSSVDPVVIETVRERVAPDERVMVVLDSNHTHAHVLAELEAYAPMVAKGSYCVVFDTVIEDMKESAFADRPWSVGNNPKTAVHEYLRRLAEDGRTARDGDRLSLQIDAGLQDKLLISVAPDGYLRRPSS